MIPEPGSMALLQPGSALISVTPNTTEGHANTQGLGHHLRPGGILRVKLQLDHIDLRDLHVTRYHGDV